MRTWPPDLRAPPRCAKNRFPARAPGAGRSAGHRGSPSPSGRPSRIPLGTTQARPGPRIGLAMIAAIGVGYRYGCLSAFGWGDHEER